MKALFVVQSDFLLSHVGVRRVVLYYLSALKREGHQVELAAPKGGQLECLRLETAANGKKMAYWTGQRAQHSDYSTVVISNPWLCADGLPDLPGCVGIVYDMVPNLIATGCLRFSNITSVYRFAHAHDVGYRYYLRNARRICCISESTRQDFLELYGPLPGGVDITTHIPFQVMTQAATESNSRRVLLVNVLDARKNLTGVSSVLEQVHATTPIQLDIVGQPRSSKSVIDAFFARLSKAGMAHKLHQHISDEALQSLYRSASVLLFPSLYEGLGLPVLEAQQEGLPAITTNISSLPEVNLNPSLCFAADDTPGMARAVREIVTGRSAVLRGEALRSALVARLARQPRVSDLMVQASGPVLNASFGGDTAPRPTAGLETGTAVGSAPLPVVTWEGSFLDHGSLSLVNRELVGALRDVSGAQIQCVSNGGPVAPDAPSLWPRWADAVASRPAGNAAITVRHAWPPNWKRPEQGKLVVIQPWEFGCLPAAWVAQAHAVDEFWLPSEYVRRVYVESGVPANKVVVVPNGVNPEVFHPQVPPLALATQKKFKFLFVGGTIGRKGPDLLLRAYLSQFTAVDDVCLVIKDFGGKSVYQGQTYEEQIRAIQATAGAPEILYLNEEMPPASLPALYTACDCLVLPYRGEGFGLPVLEAMACGRPVIVTAGGATDDFVTDACGWRIPATTRMLGEDISGMKLVAPGWLLEPDLGALGRALREASQSPEATRLRGEAACGHAQAHFTWKQAAAVAAQRISALAAAVVPPLPTAASVAAQPSPAVASLGRLDEARELLSRKEFPAAWAATLTAIGHRPVHPEAYQLLAEIALAAGAGKAAKQCAQRARDLAPGWSAARQFLCRPLKGEAKPAWLQLPAAPSQRLSVCLIVKNEEAFLAQCLKSVRGLAAQIIVVDTGSTDRTVEIAREFGAEIHFFAWCDDFAAARNVALEHAAGDWVLMLDADEELPAAQHAKLVADMKSASTIAYRLPLVNVGQEAEGRSFVPRLFRNVPGAFFQGRIHEQVFASLLGRAKQWGLKTALGTAELLHHGYTKQLVQDRDKVARNLKLLRAAIAEQPADINLQMNLGLELVRSEELTAGIEQYRLAYEMMSVQPAGDRVAELREVLLTQFTSQLYKVRAYAEVVAVLRSSLAQQGGLTASLHLALGLAQFELKQFSEAADQMRQCLAKRKQPGLTPINTDIHSAAPAHCLALCLARLGDAPGAEKAFAAALAETRHLTAAKQDYAQFLVNENRPVEALQQLNSLVAADPHLVAAWRLGGNITLARQEFLEFALEWTAAAIQALPDNPELAAQRAEALMLNSQPAAAAPIWAKLWSSEPQPRTLSAVILCQLAAGQPTHLPEAGEAERAASVAFAEWYQKLIAVRAKPLIELINSRLEELSQPLPTVAEMLRAALAEAAASVEAPAM